MMPLEKHDEYTVHNMDRKTQPYVCTTAILYKWRWWIQWALWVFCFFNRCYPTMWMAIQVSKIEFLTEKMFLIRVLLELPGMALDITASKVVVQQILLGWTLMRQERWAYNTAVEKWSGDMSSLQTWTEALCRKDSDGDGKTNGEELGDPDCKWRVNQTPSRNTGISHPGFCEPINTPK